MITCHQVQMKYGQEIVLDHIDLTINKGRRYAIVGPSGVGKTTLLHLLSGLKSPTNGYITLENTKLNGVAEQVALLLQNNNLLPWKTIKENIQLPGRLVHRDNEKNTQLIVEELGILNLLEKYPHQVSEGQRQRACIARSLSLEPAYLLMDEPSAALDPMNKETFQILLKNILNTHQTTLVFVTHDLEEAVFLADEIIILYPHKPYLIWENKWQSHGQIHRDLSFYEQCLRLREVLDEK